MKQEQASWLENSAHLAKEVNRFGYVVYGYHIEHSIVSVIWERQRGVLVQVVQAIFGESLVFRKLSAVEAKPHNLLRLNGGRNVGVPASHQVQNNWIILNEKFSDYPFYSFQGKRVQMLNETVSLIENGII